MRYLALLCFGVTVTITLTHVIAVKSSAMHTSSFARFDKSSQKLECGPMPNLMAALPNIGGALCSTPQSLADAHYYSAVQ